MIYLYPQLTQPQKPTEFGDVIITLERTACFATCPIYKLTISGDGKVVYEGKKFVNIIRMRTTQISEDKIKELIDKFNRINYFSLKDSYMNGICATDYPSAITSITINGKTKKITNYHGCPSPKKLQQLEDKIDKIANSNKWVGSK